MCSIAGWYCWDKARPSPTVVKGLLTLGQIRGRSATGVAFLTESNKIGIKKQKGPAEDFIKRVPDSDWEAIANSPIGLLHNRQTTKGDEKVNVNNHPVVGLGWVVVHNGNITNDDDLWDYYKEHKRFAEVDTSAIPLVLSQGHTIEESSEHLSTLAGPASIAAWSLAEKNKIILARFGMNEVYLFLTTTGILYWSSVATAGLVAPGLRLAGLHFSMVQRLTDGMVLVLDSDFDKCWRAKLTRSPFFYHGAKDKRKFIGETKAGTIATVVTCDYREITTINGPRETTWRQDAKSFLDKPCPNLEDSEYLWWGPELVVANKEYHTSYGRWLIDNELVCEFKPAKRVRRYLTQNLGSVPELPATETTFDLLMPLEKITVKDNGVFSFGRMCPWCGITALETTWVEWGYRCKFCNVKSSREDRS